MSAPPKERLPYRGTTRRTVTDDRRTSRRLAEKRERAQPNKATRYTTRYTICGFALESEEQELIYNLIMNQLTAHMNMTNVAEFLRAEGISCSTLREFNQVFKLHADSFASFYAQVFGEEILVLKTDSSYRLAYLGNRGAFSRNYRDFTEYIRKTRGLTIARLFDHFRIDDSNALRKAVLGKILGEKFVCTHGGLRAKLKAALPDQIKISGPPEIKEWPMLKKCRVEWISESGRRVEAPAPVSVLGQLSSASIPERVEHGSAPPRKTETIDMRIILRIMEQHRLLNFNDMIQFYESVSQTTVRMKLRELATAIRTALPDRVFIHEPRDRITRGTFWASTARRLIETTDLRRRTRITKRILLDHLRELRQVPLHSYSGYISMYYERRGLSLEVLNELFRTSATNRIEALRKGFGETGLISVNGIKESKLFLTFNENATNMQAAQGVDPTPLSADVAANTKTREETRHLMSSQEHPVPQADLIHRAEPQQPYEVTSSSPPRHNFIDEKNFWIREFLDEMGSKSQVVLSEFFSNVERKHGITVDVEMLNRIFEMQAPTRIDAIQKVFGDMGIICGIRRNVGCNNQNQESETAILFTQSPPAATAEPAERQQNKGEPSLVALMASDLVYYLTAAGGIQVIVSDAAWILKERYSHEPSLASVITYRDAFRLARAMISANHMLKLVFCNEIAFIRLAGSGLRRDPQLVESYSIPLVEDGVTLVPQNANVLHSQMYRAPSRSRQSSRRTLSADQRGDEASAPKKRRLEREGDVVGTD